ncbi:MAG: hypothetical protein KQI35_09980 [Bacteroidetes bacterium]|nr:hypothetical protein [Bacteroidota bacterium]
MNKQIPILLIGISLIIHTHAQEFDHSDNITIKRWSISGYIGWTVGGPCTDLSDKLTYYGYDDYSTGGWFSSSGKDYPRTDRSTPSWLIGLNYNLGIPFSIAVLGGKSHLGEISGHKSDALLSFIRIANTAATYTTIFSYNDHNFFKIGMGPALFNVKTWEQSRGIGDEITHNFQKIGFIAEIRIQVPNKSQFYFELNGQYRYIGNESVGPFIDRYNEGIPEIEINYNHGFIGGAFGIRF